jgi:hypothetical protein
MQAIQVVWSWFVGRASLTPAGSLTRVSLALDRQD